MATKTPYRVEPEHHVEVLGRSIADPLAAEYIAANQSPEANVSDFGDSIYYLSPKTGFSIVTYSPAHFERDVGVPLVLVADRPEAMIVQSIELSNTDPMKPGETGRYGFPLPLGLEFGDDHETVGAKLAAKSSRKTATGGSPDFSCVRFACDYWLGETRIITRLDGESRLHEIGVQLMPRFMREARERRKSLRLESRNIEPGNVSKVEALRASIPTPRWRDSMNDVEDPDQLFTEEAIGQVDAALARFVGDMAAATSKRSAPQIYSSVKRVILALNRINARTGMIETLERDELGVWIDEVIRATGFVLKEGEDITLEWRDW